MFGYDEKFHPMDDSFTEKNDWDGENGHGEDMTMYHAVFGFSAGFPLCCVLWWIHWRETLSPALMESQDGKHPVTRQGFVLCSRRCSKPSDIACHEWPEWVLELSR